MITIKHETYFFDPFNACMTLLAYECLVFSGYIGQ